MIKKIFTVCSLIVLLVSFVFFGFKSIGIDFRSDLAAVLTSQQNTFSYYDLPESYVSELKLGQVTTVKPNNIFGTHVTVMRQVDYQNYDMTDTLQLAASAGFSWIKDYDSEAARDTDLKGMTFAQKVVFFDKRLAGNTRFLNFFKTAQSLGLKPLIRIDFHYYADGDTKTDKEWTTDDGRQAYAALAQAWSKRFSPYVSDFEIGNEPNMPTTASGRAAVGNKDFNTLSNTYYAVSPEDYAVTTQIVSSAIKTGNSQVKVYGPASAWLWGMYNGSSGTLGYYARLFNAGLLNSIDVFSFHPYRPNPDQSYFTAKSYVDQISQLRTILGNAGKSLPLAATEIGFSTSIQSPSVSDFKTLATQDQKSEILDFVTGIAPDINYILRRKSFDPSLNSSEYSERNFRLVAGEPGQHDQPLPAYYALQRVNYIFDNTLIPQAINVNFKNQLITSSMWSQAFIRTSSTGEIDIVYWSTSNNTSDTSNVTLSLPGYGAPISVDLMGGDLTHAPPVTALTYSVSGDVVTIKNVPIKSTPMMLVLFPQSALGAAPSSAAVITTTTATNSQAVVVPVTAPTTTTTTSSGAIPASTVTTGGNTTPPSSVTTTPTLSYQRYAVSFRQGNASVTDAPIAATSPYYHSYSVSPSLPAGISIDPSMGIIYGTPTSVVASRTYTIFALNSSGQKVSTVIRLEVLSK
jgi:hypothetical protein